MAQLDADLTNVEANSGFEQLPPGDYPVVILESQVKATKDTLGKYLELKLQVVAGESAGRNFWDHINFRNPNQTAEKIGLGRLRAITDALGLPPKIADSVQLHNRPLVARLAKRKDEIRVSGYFKYSPEDNAAPGSVAPGEAPWTEKK